LVLWLMSIFCRVSWHIGFRFRVLAKFLMHFRENEIKNPWGVMLFLGLPLAEIEIIGYFPTVYRGAILGASFLLSEKNGERRVVLHLNWIATRAEPLGSCSRDPWVFGGPCDVVLDPILSPPHKLPGRKLYFMWPNGNYGVIHFDPKEHLSFAGDPETPRIYKYF